MRARFEALVGWWMAIAVLGCNSGEKAEGPHEPHDAPEAKGVAAAPSEVAAKADPAPPASPDDCARGRFRYDYDDRFLESLLKMTPGAKVTKTEGSFVCAIDDAKWLCETSEGGVVNQFEATVGGKSMVMTLTMKGRSTIQYTPEGPGRFRTTATDMSGLALEMSATVGGKKMPMPSPSGTTVPGVLQANTLVEYRCEGDTLRWKPVLPGVEADWATLKRVD